MIAFLAVACAFGPATTHGLSALRYRHIGLPTPEPLRYKMDQTALDRGPMRHLPSSIGPNIAPLQHYPEMRTICRI
jgi:hypothetical protein